MMKFLQIVVFTGNTFTFLGKQMYIFLKINLSAFFLGINYRHFNY